LNDSAAAQKVLHHGLEEAPSDEQLLGQLEAVLTKTNDYAGAAAALEQAVGVSTGLASTVARDLYIRAAHWYRDRAGNTSGALKALQSALELDSSNDQLLQEIDQLQRQGGDSRGLLETLQQRAQLSSDPAQREALYRQVVELAQSVEPEAADNALRGLLKVEESNAWALRTLQERCEAAGNYKEAFALLERRIALASQPDEIASLRHHAARIAREQLHSDKVAIGLYAELFEANVGDEVAAGALRELYTEGKKWADLRKVLERLIVAGATAQVRIGLRLELADLCSTKLKDNTGAMEALQGVLLDDAGHSEAVSRLNALYEATGQHAERAQLLEQQVAVAEERGESTAALTFRTTLAEVQENLLKDKGRAITTLEAILSRDPTQIASLQSLLRLLRLEGRTADRVVRLQQLIERSPQAEAVTLTAELAQAQRELGDTAGEIETLEKGRALDRSHAEFGAQLLAAYEKGARWEPLAKLVAENAESATDNGEKIALLRKAARVHLDKRQDPAAAAEMLAKASALNPTDRELSLQLCDAYTQSGRADESLRVLEQIVESFGGRRSKELVDVHQRLAAAYQSSNRTEQAIAELDKAFRIEPGNMGVLRDLGLLAFAAGDMKKSQQMFRALLLQKFEGETPISKAEVFYHLALIHEKLGEGPKALQMAERAVQTDPSLQIAVEMVAKLKG
jgi:predicted O-linked N-acetylglucosamine transferase (SPINDLY family)